MKFFVVPRSAAADAHAVVAALVEEGLHRTVGLTHDEHRILGHVRLDEVAGRRDHRVVGEEEPAASEDVLELRFVDIGVGVDPRVEETVLVVDEL